MSADTMRDVETDEAPADAADGSTRRHLRGSSLLLVGRLLAVGIGFIVQVGIVRYLTKSQFGAFSYALSITSLGSTIALLGMDKTITRFVPLYQEERDYGRLGGAIVLMVGTVLGLGVLLMMAVFAGQSLAARWITDPLSLTLLLLLSGLAPIQALDALLVGLFAVFAGPRSIFFRKHVLGPGLQLVVVAALLALRANVRFLAVGYVIAGGAGIAIYGIILFRLMARQGLLARIREAGLRLPTREIFEFTMPLTASNLAFALRGSVVVILLESMRGTADVASFRAVLPVARMDLVVLQSFTFLFTPLASRMLARRQWEGINHLYWQSAVWIAVITFPIFALSFSVARPLTLVLFGTRYTDAAATMALLSVGFYFNAALGFNALTLRVYNKVGYLMKHELLAAALYLATAVAFIPLWGAWGAAISTTSTLVYQNAAYQWGLRHTTGIRPFDTRYTGVYVTIAGGAGLLLLAELAFSPPTMVAFALAAIVSFAVVSLNRRHLRVAETFPELMRLPLARRLLGVSEHDDAIPAADILQSLHAGAGKNQDGTETALTAVWRKPNSTLYRYEIDSGATRQCIVVKAPRATDAAPEDGRIATRPRMVPFTDPVRKVEWYHAALTAIERHFHATGDGRFGAVRVFGWMPEHGALAMEYVNDPSLQSAFLGPWRGRGRRTAARRDRALMNAGAWLRQFHALPGLPHTAERHARRTDFIRAAADRVAFLRERCPSAADFARIGSEIARLAEDALPESLPLALCHGDFAPRNILVGPGERITVVDTLARWRAPACEDIALFVAGLRKAARALPDGRSTAHTRRATRLFLKGYYGAQPIPWRAIHLYEALALLDEWCSKTDPGDTARRPVSRLQSAWLRRFFYARGIEEALGSARRPDAPPNAVEPEPADPFQARPAPPVGADAAGQKRERRQ